MINKLKPKSEFSRNVVTLMTGTTIAQAIPIAISPILTRIYTPEDFGIFALFFAMISIFGSIANGRYELAIVLPKRDEDAINIFALCLIITVSFSFILFLSIVLLYKPIIDLLGTNQIGPWLYFIPITVLFIGLFNSLNYFNTRKKYYKDITNAKIIKSIILAMLQLSIGFIKEGSTGLISGQIVSQAFANWKLSKQVIKNKVLLSHISLNSIFTQAKRYKNFPIFSVWSTLSNILSRQLLNILIASYFSILTLGFYSLVQKILGLPSALIGGAIGQVFFQKATSEQQETGVAIITFQLTLKKITLISLIAYGTLYLIIEDLFTIVFGEEWRIAGTYAQAVIPFFFIRFIYASVSTTYAIFNKLNLELIWQLTLLIGFVLILFIFKDDKFTVFLTYMNWFGVIMYLISFLVIFKLVKGNK